MSVEDLRQQLRERGYLSHGVERWFALDPWSSRAFWIELVAIAAKAATLIALFGALPLTAIMLFRNAPLAAADVVFLFLSYTAAWFVTAFVYVIAIALALKLRPALAVDTPRALFAISFMASALLIAPLAFWWFRFDAPPPLPELAAGGALTVVLFVIGTLVISAALLSFSIYEVHRVPAIHQKSRALPITMGAAVLVTLLFIPAYTSPRKPGTEPMVVTAPTTRRIALIAADGLTYEILQSRPDLARLVPYSYRVARVPGRSTTERWASIGTGVRTEQHGVRSIEGVRFRGGRHLLQRISRADFVLLDALPILGLARREPLPPAVRSRDYVWEIVARRGVAATAINWWATAETESGGLHVIGPATIFTAAGADPLRVDALAAGRFLELVDRQKPRLATVYLPALDVILNRVRTDGSEQLATSIRALDGIANTVALARARGYEVILAGMPGDVQRGTPVVASTLPLATPQTAWDIAPTILDALGFPLSGEMPGRSRLPGSDAPRISSYGSRSDDGSGTTLNREYYENLRSLGYIR